MHDPSNAVFEVDGVEVDQQTKRFARQFQVSKQLRLMNRLKLVDRFQFHDHIIFNQQVKPETSIQFQTIIIHRKGHLRPTVQAAFCKFMLQAALVNAFKKSRSQGGVDLHGGVDDVTADQV